MFISKVKVLLAAFAVCLLLCSCSAYGRAIEPVKVEKIDFDITEAVEMITPGDQICAEISVRDVVSREEFEKFVSDMNAIFPDAADWDHVFFFNNEFEDRVVQELHLNKEMFYPTIFHQNIEITSAIIENKYYDEEGWMNRSFLTIREEYIGDDGNLKGWYREYIYEKNDNGEWVFSHLNGTVNFIGESYSLEYLPLK